MCVLLLSIADIVTQYERNLHCLYLSNFAQIAE